MRIGKSGKRGTRIRIWHIASAVICSLIVIALGVGDARAQGANSPIIHTTRNHVFPQTYVIDDLPLRRTVVSMIPPPTGTPENPCGGYGPSGGGTGGGVAMLTPSEGVDFAPYLSRMLDSVKKIGTRLCQRRLTPARKGAWS
jgi:hypothetical protein